MDQTTDDFPRAWDFRRTAGRKRIVAATIDHLASCSFCLNCEEHHALKMSLLIPFRLKRGYDKMVLEDLSRRRKFTHAVTVRFPLSSSTRSGVRGRFNPINYDGNYCCVCDVCHCKHFCFIRSRNFLSSPFLYACIDVFPGFNYNGMTNKHKKHAQQNSAPVRKCNYVR
jgi:hypothetical protein